MSKLLARIAGYLSNRTLVGVDKVGNRYFTRTEEIDGIMKEKRCVIFKGEGDPTSISVEWICWLNGQRKRAPTAENLENVIVSIRYRRHFISYQTRPTLVSKMSSSLFLTLILILISASQGCAAVQEKEQEKEPDLIQKSCSIIAGYEECVAILRSDPRSIKATTVKQLAYIILDLCIENATETLEEIPKLQEKYSKHDQIEEALRWCVMAYESAIKDYFRKAVDQLGTKSYREAQYSAHTGGALGTGCEQEFYFQAPVISPLWPRNHNLAVLGLVAEGIVSLLRLNESQL
ncbi:hypothetical protein NC653_001250 [Populus alba x Populus x berolinensis]|uniref:Pectinesterase inhibitor domain-containing protein n=3 Tax=Populus TaxID=3689 RepID=A0A8X8DGV6_POPTO|nr:hypothetical protein POTOM_000888 [Populus tomentosa]KAJ7010730.1 hypothetical protein NC653_001250 [Populus alba x Populus x berolinensis]